MEKINNFLENLKQVDLREVDLSVFLDWESLTEPYPGSAFIYEQWIYVVVLVNIVISVIIFAIIANRFYKIRPKYHFLRRISFLWFTNSIFLLLYNIIRSEGVRFLSMRLFLLLILLIYPGIILYVIVYWIFYLPARLEQFKKAQLRDKYNHRKKKK
jgi:hypothetical protein